MNKEVDTFKQTGESWMQKRRDFIPANSWKPPSPTNEAAPKIIQIYINSKDGGDWLD